MARPKRDSTFAQKTRIVPSRETSGSSQNIFFSYNQRKKQSRARTDIFGTYSTSFCKVGVFLSVRLPIILRKVCTKIIKTIAHNPKRRRPRFRKKSKAVFICIWYRKTSQTQYVKSQITERSVRGKKAQPKRDSAFEQKTRIFSCREISAFSQNNFFYLQPKKKAEQSSNRHFWNVLNVILEGWCFPFGEIAHYFSDGLYENHQNNCTQSKTTKTTFPKKSKAVFF